MVNRGIAPPDPGTDVGQFRFTFGDTEYTDLPEPEIGYGDYVYFSDDEITALLARADDSITRAIGYAYLTLASRAAIQSKFVKDYDLQIDSTKRSADLRAIAQFWFDQADDEDDNNGLGEYFELVPTGRQGCGRCELSEGRTCYCNAEW